MPSVLQSTYGDVATCERQDVTREPEKDDNDDIEAALRRMQEEFGPRRGAEEDELPPQPPLYGEARPVAPPQVVQLQLPLSQASASWALLGLNVLIYLLTGLLSFNLFTPDPRVLQLLGWKQNDLILQGEYWRLLTAMFLHGNLVHIFFNGYALYALGPEAERLYGTARFLAVYFLAGLAGSVASYAFSLSPSVGASGAIFGLIGCLAVFFYESREVLGDAGRRQLQGMLTIIVINLLLGFTMGGVIDNFAHIGGLLGGSLVGWLLAPRLVVDARLYPPVVVRRFLGFGWAGAAGFLLLLVLLVLLIQPPLLSLP